MQTKNIFTKKFKSPVGNLHLFATETHLIGLLFDNDETTFLKHFKNAKVVTGSNAILSETMIQLKQYFAGTRKKFNLNLFAAGTEFQKKVWSELSRIPFGKTITYKAQAQRIKSPKAVRAVGAANGKNPLAIIIPCHRVVGSNGKLVGYVGGQNLKSALLKLEGLNFPIDIG